MLTNQLRLDAETTNGNGEWVTGPDNGIVRLTGESGNYQLLYTISSTTYGTFNNVVLRVELYDAYSNIVSFYGVGVSADVSYTTSVITNNKTLTINLGSGLQAGQSGIIHFSVLSDPNRGPNEYHIVSVATLSGSFQDLTTGDIESFEETYNGPYWEVSAVNPHDYTKTVSINGSIYTEDEDAYIVEYSIRDVVTDSEGGEGIGSWGYTNAYTVDTLPTPGGVNPVVLLSNVTPYTVNGNQVIWDVKPPNNSYHPYGYTLMLRVQYPKAAIDAIGGIAALGEITNTVDVHFTLIGDVEDIKSASVSHVIEPIPVPITGIAYANKVPQIFNDDNPYPGNALFAQDGTIQFAIVTGVLNTNILTAEMLVTDFTPSYQLVNGEIVTLTEQDFAWRNIKITTTGISGVLEYATNLNPTFQIGPVVEQTIVPFPTVGAGEYITQWRIRINNNEYPTQRVRTDVYITLKQRAEDSPRIESLSNTIKNEITLTTGASLSTDITATVPFNYDNRIHWELIYLRVSEPVVSLGGTFIVTANSTIKSSTSVTVLSSHLYLLIPDDFIFVSGNGSNDTAIPNWNDTGMTLVHSIMSRNSPPLAQAWYTRRLTFRARVTAALGAQTIQAYYVIDSEQASDPSITFNPEGATAPDIFDFHANGNTQELVPYRTVAVTLAPVNVVNILKMSKAFTDSDYVVNNNTRITGRERFQYKFFVRNDSSTDMTYVTMIDILPYAGDQFTSSWSPLLVAPPIAPDYVTISYSLSTTPDMRPIYDTGDGEWSTTPPDDITTVRALKFDFGDHIFNPGQQTEIYMNMEAPADAPDSSRAYNSVYYLASAISDGYVTPYLPAFSPPAYAQLTFWNVFDTFVGDFVWMDLNGNGIHDEDEPGINGVTVQLLDDVGQVIYETVTTNHPVTGEPGYYEFTGIWPEPYIATFPVQLPDGSTLTMQRQIGDTGTNSAPDMETGFTEEFTVQDGIYITDIDAGYIPQIPVTGTIGDFVWNDLNGNGIQDPGEPGINGVTVNLIYDTSTYMIAQQVTSNHPVTNEPGYYEFTGVPLGDYRVQFPTSLEDGSTLTVQNAGNDDNLNSKPDPLSGYTPQFAVMSEQPILNIDAGYVTPPVEPEEDIIFTKSVDKSSASPCDCITYTLQFENRTSQIVDRLVITDALDICALQFCSLLVEINGVQTQQFVHEHATEGSSNTHVIELTEPLQPGDVLTIMIKAQVAPCACPQVLENTAYAVWLGRSMSDTATITITNPCTPCS